MDTEIKRPKPFVKPDVNLQKYSWMKLDIIRLQNSNSWHQCSTMPYAAYACINLWMAAWHQVPAGSIPVDEAWIKKRADVSDEVWKSIRRTVLGNFTRCSDDRLYHRVLCDMINEVWASKIKNAAKTQPARDAMEKKRKSEEKQKKQQNSEINTPKGVKDCNNPTPLKTKGNSGSNSEKRNDDSLLQEGIENRIEENRIEEPNGSTRGPAREAADDAVLVRDEFLRLRIEFFPNDPSMPAPTMTLDADAQSWLDKGAPAQLLCEVMRRQMEVNVNNGKSFAPTNLKFCKFKFDSVLAEYKNTGASPEAPNRALADRDLNRERLIEDLIKAVTLEQLKAMNLDLMSSDEIQQVINKGK